MEFGENGYEGSVHNPPGGEPHPFEMCERHGHIDPRRPDAPAGPLHEALYRKSADGRTTLILDLPDSKSADGRTTLILDLPDSKYDRLLALAGLVNKLSELSQQRVEAAEPVGPAPVDATVGGAKAALTPKQRRAFTEELASTPAADLPGLIERWREVAQAGQDRRNRRTRATP